MVYSGSPPQAARAIRNAFGHAKWRAASALKMKEKIVNALH